MEPGLGLGLWEYEQTSLEGLKGCKSWGKSWTTGGTGGGKKSM